jgi:hypothetical protein
MTGRAACPVINLKQAQTLNADRTCPAKQRLRLVQRPVTYVTSVHHHFFSDFWRSVKKSFQLLENA